MPGDICLWPDGRWAERDKLSWSDRFADPDHILIPEGTTEWVDFCVKHKII